MMYITCTLPKDLPVYKPCENYFSKLIKILVSHTNFSLQKIACYGNL